MHHCTSEITHSPAVKSELEESACHLENAKATYPSKFNKCAPASS